MMKLSVYPVLLTALFMLALAACDKGPEYVKYNNLENVPRISLEDAKKDFDARTAIFIDSRAPSNYQAEHVLGSINIPEGEVDSRINEVPRGKKLIIYCS